MVTLMFSLRGASGLELWQFPQVPLSPGAPAKPGFPAVLEIPI